MKKLPELEKLEEVAGELDFLVQEGVIYKKENYDRAWFLVQDIMKSFRSLEVNMKEYEHVQAQKI